MAGRRRGVDTAPMRAMRMLRLVVHGRTHQPVAVLGEVEAATPERRCVPVFLRRPQADAIALGRRGENDVLLPQDVLLPLLRGLGHTLDGVEVTELSDGVFSAVVVCDGGTRVPVLPSDAVAVAVREGLPINMAEEILDAVGQPVTEVFPEGVEEPPEEQMREMRDFLEDASPDDFADPPRPEPGA
jgi:bifunctional DNase/RNase